MNAKPPTADDAQELLPTPLPACPQHGPMRLRPGWTREQRWCGTWYQCRHCGNTVLLPSPELLAQLAEQRAASAAANAPSSGSRQRSHPG